MHIEMRQEIWWVQSLMKLCVVIFYIQRARMTCMHLQHSKSYIGFMAFEISKVRFRGQFIGWNF